MTALLEDRVSLWVADHPGRTVEDIARSVRAQTAAVRQVLSGPLFRHSLCNGRKLYSLAADGLGRASGGVETDSDFLLRVLRDGRPHSLNEILQRSFRERGCGLTVHSRAADLRVKRGYDIRNWKDGERGAGSWYRLAGLLDDGASTRAGGSAPSSSGPATDGLLSPPYQEQDGAAQLTLLEQPARGAYGEAA